MFKRHDPRGRGSSHFDRIVKNALFLQESSSVATAVKCRQSSGRILVFKMYDISIAKLSTTGASDTGSSNETIKTDVPCVTR